jgi:predicted negative regulator of RcsB-dependent stress response
MAVYDLEEQEKLDDLKAWWKQWGNAVTFGIALAFIVIAGVQGYRWWMSNKAAEASVLYNAVSDAARKSDAAKGKDAIAELTGKFGGTSYAPRGAMVYAKQLFDSGDKAGAKAQLAWAVDNASEDELKAIARFRLAEIQLDDKQYDEALKTLDAKVPDAFKGLFADLRGDALVAAGRTADARTAYQEAFTALDPKSPYRGYVQVKLDTVGGPIASATGAPVTAPAPAPAPPAPAAAPAAPAAKAVAPAPDMPKK